jgi:ABC-2 type transport system ATP-binding protein
MLAVENISKEFKGKPVLSSVSMSVNPNEIVGIIGPNGSGKTTLLNIICGFVKPNAGRIQINSTRSSMSISRKGFFDDMTVQRNLEMYAHISGVPGTRVAKVLEELQIDFGKKSFGKLSAGMKQKVSLAFAFLEEADLILLDEPLTHLDVSAILTLRSLIQKRKQGGASFLIASHILSDLEQVCDRIYFFRSGQVLHTGTVTEVLSTYGTLENAYVEIV